MIAGGVVSTAMLCWVTVATHGSALALVPFLALTTAVLIHMPFSVGFHLFRGISADVYNLWRRLDQVCAACSAVLVCMPAGNPH
jgi:predicted membrane channel-forming protein YqfA (hemolysin III family)